MSKIDHFKIVLEQFPVSPQVHEISNSQFDAITRKLVQTVQELDDEGERIAALELGFAHPVWQVRFRILDVASQWLPLPAAEKTILNGTHDSVDVVAFKAINLCGQHRLRSALTHLSRISGWPSSFSKPGALRKPVGIGAAMTKNAMTQILGSDEYEPLVKLEQEFLKPLEELRNSKPEPDTSGMVFIPRGPCKIGTYKRDDFQFEYHDYVPEQIVDVPVFYIDAKPVTNSEYCAFVRAIERYDHICCHRDERTNKDHWPSHMRDLRFGGDDMPVVGIDWYDAYSYAAWHGKKLPSEVQWEKAARGDDGRDYPWGNQWRPDLANCAETAYGQKVESLTHWEKLLRTVSDEFPSNPVWPVGSRPEGNSPYGLYDMSGNVWEWTETNFFTREPMDPFFKGREPLSFTNRRPAFPVIRGGCWTSLPEMLRTFYRGKDLLTDRHFEIGFRCVVEA